MRQQALLRHLRWHGCILRREAKSILSGRIPKPATRKPFQGIRKSRICWRGRFAGGFRFPIHRAENFSDCGKASGTPEFHPESKTPCFDFAGLTGNRTTSRLQ